MLIGAFGVPAPFTYWLVGVIRTLVEQCCPERQFIETSSFDALQAASTANDMAAVVYFCDCPESEIVDTFIANGAPYLVCLEPPLDIVGFCMRERNMSEVVALRFATQSLSALHDLALGSQAKVMIRTPELTAAEALLQLLSVFPLTDDANLVVRSAGIASDEEFSRVKLDDLLLRVSPNARAYGFYASELASTTGFRWLCRIADAYGSLLDGRPLEAVYWPRETFLDPHAENEVVAARQKLMGPSRHLIFGPFLHLPRGAWRITVKFEVLDAASSSMRADVAVAGVPWEAVRFDLPERGQFEFHMTLQVIEPRRFLEVRMELLNGAIEGEIAFHGAFLKRLSGPDQAQSPHPSRALN